MIVKGLKSFMINVGAKYMIVIKSLLPVSLFLNLYLKDVERVLPPPCFPERHED